MNSLKKDSVRIFARQMARELLPVEINQVSGSGLSFSTIVLSADGMYWVDGADDSTPAPRCG